MTVGTATRKTVPVDFWYLETPADFDAALNNLYAMGFTGSITSNKDLGDGHQVLEVVLNSAAQRNIRGVLTNVLVWDNIQLQSLPIETFMASYTIP